ncbi:MAG: molybdopterin-dependent oxidoreductase [Ignavibacteria bacterium]|jgi:anaerobic selenocysteine-containing dehydrogenase|nr:molybdopterin-dependent oxidoreductase [Ignavibacteria bacterium]MCU7504900.1 molybdopterin-dependent oxidoreductase [Ignavibacteria bacterium]MCU7517808.1 molybdopterin-dependent oxidoreductase [Ignavibacteria bacterium]
MQQTRDSIKDIWGERTPYYGSWPERVDERTLEEPERWVQSACVLCSNDCAMDIGVKDGKIVGVRGRAVDRVNRGRLGPKGLHGWEANNSPDRLKFPMVRKNGKLERATWNEAMDLIVRRSKEIVKSHTASAIGFYTTGQLFIEEYYTLGVIGKAGLGTPHMDGNTRLCTATAAASLMESFGSDGQPGSYTDLDTTELIMLVGHNMSNTQTVLWARILDRLEGPNPPAIVVIDPRKTWTADKASVHLAPRVGTNVAVLNGLEHLLIESGNIDTEFIEQHTTGFEALKKALSSYTPDAVEKITGIPSGDLLRAAELIGRAKSMVSTCLQGVYQSMQATASACQVNNIHLLRGMLGREGCGILQMNGQPTAQNTRETGCDGALPAFRNWDNPDHIEELARIWNVDPVIIPHWSPPTHAMQIFRYCEQGSIKMLWVSATNPAVSMPDLARMRAILDKHDLFLVVQDAFLTETSHRADVLLPAAIWGEKTGTFTNVDRTVHISHKAVDPPGEARPDLDIFLDYARRMDFKDKDGQPLIKWGDPEGAFEAWKECTKGKMCDYSGMTYEKLSQGSGIQWPCNEKFPDGANHIYTDFVFNTSYENCETFGHDLDTGAVTSPQEYKAIDPKGKAWLRAADYHPPHEVPDGEYPFWLTTGRVVYHFHTRTKTGRSRQLYDAAPDAFVQIPEADASRLGIKEGDWLEVTSRRGMVQVQAKIGRIEPGQLFIPFHYGYWDGDFRPRAANELTITEWDPVSKQPHFKYAAVNISKISPQQLSEDPDKEKHRGVFQSIGSLIDTISGAILIGGKH